MKVYSFRVSEQCATLQPNRNTPRKPMARAYVPREIRESCIALVTRHGRTLRETQLITRLNEKQILEVLLEWCADERAKAYRQGYLAPRGPLPPTNAGRRAA